MILENVNVIDGIADCVIRGQDIIVDGQRILAIEPSGSGARHPDATILNLAGKFVIAGLMDANVHLMAGLQLEQLVRYEGRFEDLIIEAAQIALKGGLTTVFDTWGPRLPLFHVRELVNKGEVIGSRIYCAGNIIGLDGPISADFFAGALSVATPGLVSRLNAQWVENVGPDLTWMTPDQVAEEIRPYLRNGIDFMKYAANEHRGNEQNSFFLFSERVQGLIVEEAHRAGLTAQVHATSVEGIRVALQSGTDIVQHCNLTGPVALPDSTLGLFLERGAVGVPFPLTERRLKHFNRTVGGHGRRYWHTADQNCRNAIGAGVTLALGTDGTIIPEIDDDPTMAGSAMNGSEDNLWKLGEGHLHWLVAMEEKGLRAIEGLRAATINIARAYRVDDDLGSIEAGKIADLLVLDENPLEAARNYQAIHTVIKEGAVVPRDALPTTPLLTAPSPVLSPEAASYGKFASTKFPRCCGVFN